MWRWWEDEGWGSFCTKLALCTYDIWAAQMIHAPRNWPQQDLHHPSYRQSVHSTSFVHFRWNNFGQIFGLILHTHCRRPARLTAATSIVLSYPWWASALGFSRWVFNVFLSVVFSTLAAPGSTSFQAVQRSSAVQFVLCQDAPGLPEMPTKTALGVRMKFALGLCPWVLHSELQSTQSPTETVSTRKCCVSYFRCLWVIFVGNFGLKILGFGLFSSSALYATIFRGQNLGPQLDTLGCVNRDFQCLWVSAVALWELGATGVVPARVEVPPHSLFSACLCPQTIFAYFAHKQSALWQTLENQTFKQKTVEHLEKKRKSSR